MSDLEVVQCDDAATASQVAVPASFRGLVGEVGRAGFYERFGHLFHEAWGAEHVHVWLFEGTRPRILSGFSNDGSGAAEHMARTYMAKQLWHHDTAMSVGSRIETGLPTVFRLDTARPSSSELRSFYTSAHMRDRLVMCGRESFGILGVSLVRSGARAAGDSDLGDRFLASSDLVFQTLAKHIEVCCRDKAFLGAFSSLALIEQVLSEASDPIPFRQAQVCARFLYGLSAPSIALDMNLALETVLTYRKRLYQRLAITSHRELMLWYLDLHADWLDEVAIEATLGLKSIA